ncbi:PEP-CTERM sorting domain-containing protein [Pseudomaricurvus sp.]|uniref:PEP-CTERM sorting domain-containing protein n=1 Tax=Pseudomaricurvus sp. TaxID=2004510 RepID=UPI003F6C9723
MAQSASAGLIVDSFDVDTDVNIGGQYSYFHDITGYGFTPGLDTAWSGSLAIEIFDDGCDVFFCADEWFLEIALVQVEELDFDSGGITFGDFGSDLELEALTSLNTNGQLNVTIRSISGDFHIGHSTLSVDVPTPGTAALLGLGLLGLGLGHRRKKT